MQYLRTVYLDAYSLWYRHQDCYKAKKINQAVRRELKEVFPIEDYRDTTRLWQVTEVELNQHLCASRRQPMLLTGH